MVPPSFPIVNVSAVLDYITLITCDSRGQWDHGVAYIHDGCATENCLHSHVNLTTGTKYAPEVITKARVPAIEVAVGIASCARTYCMFDDSCTGPNCFFASPDSIAEPRPCTNTAGIVAEADLQLLLDTAVAGTRSWCNEESDSGMVIFDGTLIACMSE